MYLDDVLLNQLITTKQCILGEYIRYRHFLTTNYNRGYNVAPLKNDQFSYKLSLMRRGKKII
jgi:hypothetical protein